MISVALLPRAFVENLGNIEVVHLLRAGTRSIVGSTWQCYAHIAAETVAQQDYTVIGQYMSSRASIANAPLGYGSQPSAA